VSGRQSLIRNRWLVMTGWVTLLLMSAFLCARQEMLAQTAEPAAQLPIQISCDYLQEVSPDIQVSAAAKKYLLRGHCVIQQGDSVLSAHKAVVWQRKQKGKNRLTVYLEDHAQYNQPGRTVSDTTLVVELVTQNAVVFRPRRQVPSVATVQDALFQRAEKRKDAIQRTNLRQTQLLVSEKDSGPSFRHSASRQPTPDMRRIRVFPRSAVPFNVDTFRSTKTTPPEQIFVITGGVNVVIDGVAGIGTADLMADRVVIWTTASDVEGFNAETLQNQDAPYQLYLEGNIIVRQGTYVSHAERAFYDVKEERALLLDAEIEATIPEFEGSLRVKAERIRQLSRNSYHAQNSWMTTSQLGEPTYRLQATDVFLDYRYTTPWLGTTAGEYDPETGAPIAEEIPWVESLNNTFIFGQIPLFYSSRISGPAADPNIPLRNITVASDSIFGVQLKTEWNMFKLLGWDKPSGVDWSSEFDILSDRGPGIGTSGEYKGGDLFGVPGKYRGEGLLYYIYDTGKDNLGRDRRSLSPETNNRWRAQLRHHQQLPGNFELFGELGLLSDRNFLEQYYEKEFDERKDVETLLYLKHHWGNWGSSILARPELNGFETNTQWAPKADFYVLGEPILGGWLTWSTHSSVGNARLHPADAPTDPADTFSPLPYVSNSRGTVAMTRHELAAPFSLGALHIVPYAMGEAAHWEEDFAQNDIDRLYGNAGIRASLMFWKVFPELNSRIFNLNGLAHKMVFDADYSYSDSSRSLTEIPQYNEFDDNAQERFRNRFLTDTFGGVLPPIVAPRFYAVRQGAGRTVTAPYHELVDDQQVLRLGWRHRLQTKVGPQENMRIKDWMTLDLEASYFPKPVEDNFSEDVGLFAAHYAWNVGDRTSFLADTMYDFFDDGQELWSLAVLNQRSARGSLYFGLRQIRGGAAVNSRILTASYSYRMSPKWISTFGTAFDIAEDRNRGQSLTLTRIGESFLIHFGASYDHSKDNAGIGISIEPKLGPFNSSSSQLSSLLGIQ